jgi:hypothetical protein
VPISTTIEALAAQCSLSNPQCIFNGQILDPNSTFKQSGIKDNDSIVFVSGNGARDAADRWMRMTREGDMFSDTVQFAIRKESRADFLRLKDLRVNRLECRPRAFRKFMANHMDADTPEVIRFATFIGEAPSELSCNPLPVCW